MRTLSHAVLFCAFLSTTAVAQTNNRAAAPPQKPAGATRNIPAIKCTDHSAAASCKSFNQLVGARDEQLLRDVLGAPGVNKRHISYVCLRPHDDAFNVIDYYIPEPKEYRLFWDLNEEIAKFDKEIAEYADDSPHANRALRQTAEGLRENAERTRKLEEDEEFSDLSDPPAVSRYTKDQWFQDHGRDFVYTVGFITVSRYQAGLNKGPAIETGEWRMRPSDRGGAQNDPQTWFTGAYAWIEGFNRQHGNVSARDDEPQTAHISLDPSSIYIHYKFENPAGDMVDYTMQMNRLTGRFVEDFKFPYSSDEASGTCVVFK